MYVKPGAWDGKVNDIPVHVPWLTVTVPPFATPLIAVWRFAQVTAPAGAASASAPTNTTAAASAAGRLGLRVIRG